jgi:hypothetical protein
MAERLKRESPAMKKMQIAEALIASEEFDSMDTATVARIIRVPRKIRRKKFA